MKNKNLLKLNILSAVIVISFSANVVADELSLTEIYGPAAFDLTSEKIVLDENATVVSDYDFNQINRTGQITSGDIDAIKQIVVAEPSTQTTASNNIAMPVASPTAQAVTQPITPVSEANIHGAITNITGAINPTSFTTKTITSAKVQNISAPTHILVNLSTQHIYTAKNQDTKYNPSGLTNLMTAYIATQHLKMDSVLNVNKSALRGIPKDASIAALYDGDTITLKDAIASMFVKGCVDSANVVAENVSNSVDDFVKLMNDTATNLGLTNTKFVDPSGIGNNESTAFDMAIIMAKVCENEELAKLLSLYEYELPAAKKRGKLMLWSKNTQLNKGGSTYNADVSASRLAYTSASKWCIASMMRHNDNTLIAVVLKAEGTQFGDTRKLFEFGKTATTEDLSAK